MAVSLRHLGPRSRDELLRTPPGRHLPLKTKRNIHGRKEPLRALFVYDERRTHERAAMRRLDIIQFSDLPSRLVSHCTEHPTESSSPSQSLNVSAFGAPA